MAEARQKVLILRMDKIGDLLCTLPIDQILDSEKYEVHWVVSKGLGFLASSANPPRSYTELDKSNPNEAQKKLARLLKEFQPSAAVSIQCPWWVNFALWKAKIPLRGGVLSKADSFLFLNKGLRQKRSLATKHESDYSRELLEHTLNLPSWKPTSEQKFASPILSLSAPDHASKLQEYSLSPQHYYVVHPGMAGSALNWPSSHYCELISSLKTKFPIVITGTPADENWLVEIKQRFSKDSQVHILQSVLTMPELLYFLKNAKAVIAPSTGVIHLAAALGTPVVGFYSPRTVQHPTRWAPRGSGKRLLFLPEVSHPNEAQAEDMGKITTEAVLKKMTENGL